MMKNQNAVERRCNSSIEKDGGRIYVPPLFKKIKTSKSKKMAYKKNKVQATTLKVNVAYVGETIEQKIDRILNNKEPIKDGAPLIYTERKEGVKPEHDVRTDRFELAVDAMDKVNKDKIAKRQERQDVRDGKAEVKDGKVVPINREKGGENDGKGAGGEGKA